MNEKVMQFLAKVSEDKELTEKIGKETNVKNLIAIAKKMGFDLTEADFEKEARELSDDELDTVAGGKSYPMNCVCVVGGGGSGDDDDTVCPCVLAGIGYTQVNGHNQERCICTGAGFGIDY